MVAHGFPLEGFRFDWDYSVDFTPEQQVAYETMVADRYEVDPAYFAEKYSMPVGERRNNMPMMEPQEDPDDNSRASQKNGTRSNSQVQPQNPDDKKGKTDDKKKQQKNIHSFFVQAPQDGAHLDW